MRSLSHALLTLLLTISSFVVPLAPIAHAESLAPLDTPTPLVTSGVTSFALAAPKIFWHTQVPQCPPKAAATAADANADYTELIRRVATYGSTVRALYAEPRDCGEGVIANPILADADYVYWLANDGLWRLSTNANPGDDPELMNALVKTPGELADGGDRIYVISNNTTGNTELAYVLKANQQKVSLTTLSNTARDLASDGEYYYYITNGTLYRFVPGAAIGALIPNVTSFYPEGRRLSFCTVNPIQCNYTNNVYVAKGNQIFVYNNLTNNLNSTPIYTSANSTANISHLTSDANKLFFFERHALACNPAPCFPPQNHLLQRIGRGGGTVETLHVFGPVVGAGSENLQSDGKFLFWQESGKVQRLPNDAAALPKINLRVTGMEVTQGIQDLNNSVLLVKERRTFVRVYVKSDGAAVAGVTARLQALGQTIKPVNPVGTHITVRANPDRNDLNQSFLFELPWQWTEQDTLNMQVQINPYEVPLEPQYGDNSRSVTVGFQPSPTLSVEFFRLNYDLDNSTHSPRLWDDVFKTYSWIMRAYPLGGAVGDNFKPRLWDVDGGSTLGSLVDRSNPVCDLIYPDEDDDTHLCASYVMNSRLWNYRIDTAMGLLNSGLKLNAFYYGIIADSAGYFPRGQAAMPLTSVGPSGVPGQPMAFEEGNGLGGSWDTDGTYADWYAGHEIGHSLGRAHPNAGSDNPSTDDVRENCGHSRSDPSYPYGNTSSSAAPIGPADNSMAGFDVGDPSAGIAKAVLPSTTWNDMMSYCANQWLSDYTYEAIYNHMRNNPSLTAATAPQGGEFLAVTGIINPTNNSAAFGSVQRLESVVNRPPLTAGDYAIRLLDAQGSTLAEYAFTPSEPDDGDHMSFGQVVDFVAGTTQVQIVRLSSDQALTTVPISANAPTVSNVALVGAGNPVSGTVTLAWNATDVDSDTLSFDIAYSPNNGVSFHPVVTGLTSSGPEIETEIDTAQLGGSGTAILRVTATDGVNRAFADSAPFTMANKPPQPFILTPGAVTEVHYGQLVNFSGMALDVQDGTVASDNLTWFRGRSILGSGAFLSLDDLPVGTHTIVLRATNSVGLTASTSVTVIVDDNLNLPGPTLTAGPMQVGWHIAMGESTAQTAQISINNAGSGSLNWQATSNQPWLTLSTDEGTVEASGDPNILTLTADPTGLAGSQSHGAQLFISTPAIGATAAQTITIPVSLSIGDIVTPAQAPPSGTLDQKIYLPMVMR